MGGEHSSSTAPLPEESTPSALPQGSCLIQIACSERPYHPRPQILPLAGLVEVRIGRGESEECERRGKSIQLTLADPCLSSQHARLTLSGNGGWLFEDLESRNGSRINGRIVSAPQPLRPNDILETGFTFWKLWRGPRAGIDAAARALDGAADEISVTSSTSPALLATYAQMRRIASSAMPLIISGETGTGKEVIAHEIHRLSGRTGPFLAVNCAALPEGLVEGELFGHVKGSFTGATASRAGVIERAGGGTLLLDEVGDMPLAAQAKLLRVLQENSLVRVGGSASIDIDVRYLAATHQPLPQLIEDGRFRGDLYARLNGFVLSLPPLRDRLEDLGFLVAQFLRGAERRQGRRYEVAHEVFRAFTRHAWPFNVRELEKTVEVAVTLCADDPRIQMAHLPEALRGPQSSADEERPPEAPSRPENLREALVDLLESTAGNVSAIARELDTSRSQVHRWLKRYKLELSAYRPGRLKS